MLAVKGAAALVTPKENEPLRIRVLRFTAIAAIIVAAVASGVYLLTNSSGNGLANSGNNTSATSQPTVAGKTTAPPKTKATTKTTAKPKSSTSTGKGATAATAGYVLSTPATAGGYPQGQDPHFIATATTTAQSIISTVVSGGGGTVTGNPVSAPYRLPNNNQVITFVGYKGTFNPGKIITSMGSFGTTDNTYQGGAHGGQIACANTPATASSPSAAVCLWATATTLGITEFFDATGPEALTASQHKGAVDTENLRSGVEAKK